MLVRRISEAAPLDVHKLRARVLMDAGELGSRNLSVNWLEVPPGCSERLRSHEDAEQVYVVVAGRGELSATGDTQELGPGDLVMIPPATDHAVGNSGSEGFTLLSVQSPGVSADELFSLGLATQAAGYDEFADDYE